MQKPRNAHLLEAAGLLKAVCIVAMDCSWKAHELRSLKRRNKRMRRVACWLAKQTTV